MIVSIGCSVAVMRTTPAGLSRKSDSAASCAVISSMRGATAWNSASPASVVDTLRVVRVSSRTPTRASRSRMVWLSADCDTPSRVAARVSCARGPPRETRAGRSGFRAPCRNAPVGTDANRSTAGGDSSVWLMSPSAPRYLIDPRRITRLRSHRPMRRGSARTLGLPAFRQPHDYPLFTAVAATAALVASGSPFAQSAPGLTREQVRWTCSATRPPASIRRV